VIGEAMKFETEFETQAKEEVFGDLRRAEKENGKNEGMA
jgi:hypothetical protein